MFILPGQFRAALRKNSPTGLPTRQARDLPSPRLSYGMHPLPRSGRPDEYSDHVEFTV